MEPPWSYKTRSGDVSCRWANRPSIEKRHSQDTPSWQDPTSDSPAQRAYFVMSMPVVDWRGLSRHRRPSRLEAGTQRLRPKTGRRPVPTYIGPTYTSQAYQRPDGACGLLPAKASDMLSSMARCTGCDVVWCEWDWTPNVTSASPTPAVDEHTGRRGHATQPATADSRGHWGLEPKPSPAQQSTAARK